MEKHHQMQWALITGGSSGIGLSMARCLAKKGYNIILTARREKHLVEAVISIKKEFSVETSYCVADLASPEAPNLIYLHCQKLQGKVTILINNAGYALPTPFHKTPMEDEEKFLRVLGISVIALTKLFLTDMMTQGGGKIAIVSSVAAFAPPSSIQPLYGPIKTFVNRFSEGININYNAKGITSTAICPGYTITNFHSASGVQEQMDRVPSFMKKNADRIASEGVEALLNGKKICVPTLTFKIIVFLLRILPHSLFSLFSRLLAPGRYEN